MNVTTQAGHQISEEEILSLAARILQARRKVHRGGREGRPTVPTPCRTCGLLMPSATLARKHGCAKTKRGNW